MKLNSGQISGILWGITVPMWGASAAFNAASGHTGLAALNIGLVALNGYLSYSGFKRGAEETKREQERKDADARFKAIFPDKNDPQP